MIALFKFLIEEEALDKYLTNLFNDFTNKETLMSTRHSPQNIEEAFLWSESPEYFEFWEDLNNKFKKEDNGTNKIPDERRSIK